MTDGLSSLMVVEQNSVYQGDVSVNEGFKQLKKLLSKHKTVLVNRRTGRPTEKKKKRKTEVSRLFILFSFSHWTL